MLEGAKQMPKCASIMLHVLSLKLDGACDTNLMAHTVLPNRPWDLLAIAEWAAMLLVATVAMGVAVRLEHAYET
jgi:ABC-type antimicrobial peptide transport system permease subunit